MRIELSEKIKLYQESDLASFLGISPLDPAGWEKSLARLATRPPIDEKLIEQILAYNLSIGNGGKAEASIRELGKEGAVCVFTGQQLGFMGGPAYTILKGISCLLLARLHQAVPVFWLATEDHDIGEIDHAYLQDGKGNLKKWHLALPKDGRSVEAIELDPGHLEVVKAFLEEAGAPEIYESLSQIRDYSKMMATLLARLFKGTGLVFLEPRLLRPFSVPFFKKEIEEAFEINSILKDATKRLVEAGGKAQIEGFSATNLFMKGAGGRRLAVKAVGDKFQAGASEFTKEGLLERIGERPEDFGTNAAARPVLQSLLFRTAAYVAGPGEIAYYHQLNDYHRFHGVQMPWIVPRISATMVSPLAEETLRLCRMAPWDALPKTWHEALPELEDGCAMIEEGWLERANGLTDIPPGKVQSFVQGSFEQFLRRVVHFRLKARGIPSHSLHYLNNCLRPHETLQERVLNWLQFQGQTREDLVQEMLKSLDIRFQGHHFCYLS